MVSQPQTIAPDPAVPPWRPELQIGGHAALDLVNTVSHRWEPARARDRLASAEQIATWCAWQNLIEDGRIDDVAVAFAAAPRRKAIASLRQQAGALFDAIAGGKAPPAEALARVLATAAAGAPALTAAAGPDGDRYALPAGAVPSEAVLALIGLEIIAALHRLPRDRIRTCDGCGWLFRDVSRGGRRRWCSMADCGNRAKARRHYRAKTKR